MFSKSYDVGRYWWANKIRGEEKSLKSIKLRITKFLIRNIKFAMIIVLKGFYLLQEMLHVALLILAPWTIKFIYYIIFSLKLLIWFLYLYLFISWKTNGVCFTARSSPLAWITLTKIFYICCDIKQMRKIFNSTEKLLPHNHDHLLLHLKQ